MRRLTLTAAAAAAVVVFGTAPAAAHNAGCVQTGTGEWVFVGSGNEAPLVPEQNPNRNATPGPDFGRLDLQPGPGDQYGARYAADQGKLGGRASLTDDLHSARTARLSGAGKQSRGVCGAPRSCFRPGTRPRRAGRRR